MFCSIAATLRRALPVCLAALLIVAILTARPASANFTPTLTYTGQLLVNGQPVSGTYDFQFGLYTAATGGSQVGSTISVSNVSVAAGVYYVALNFGSASFTGQTLYLQAAYGLHPASSYTPVSPRPLVATSAYADFALLSSNTQSLQGHFVSAALPTNGQVLTWTNNGSKWIPAALPTPPTYTAGAGLVLSGNAFSITVPLNLTGASSSPILQANNTGAGYGLSASSAAVGFAGILGTDNSRDPSSNGVLGKSNDGNGVSGYSSGGNGVFGQSDTGYGVFGFNTTIRDFGYLGVVDPLFLVPAGAVGIDNNLNGEGVLGYSSGTNGIGVYGLCDTGTGIYGVSLDGYGCIGLSNTSVGVFGRSTSGLAGFFQGNVAVTGSITAGTKDFRIDHPLDPANKYLYHASVESNEMKNIYDGDVTTDTHGNALVTLPDWFQALNGNFRYQLTVIGQFAQAIVVAKIQNNQFTIKTDKPNVEVSWQVTGVRHDAFALAHPLQVEEDKTEKEQGLYQNPEAFGLPAKMSICHMQQKLQVKR